MDAYEYTYRKFTGTITQMIDEMNKLGLNGWELVTTEPISIFKRKILNISNERE